MPDIDNFLAIVLAVAVDYIADTDALPRAGCEEFISRASDFAGGQQITSEHLAATFDYVGELSSECQGRLLEDLAEAIKNG